VLTSIGYRGEPVPDLPFEPAAGIVPNDRGRVRGEDRTYVAGWIKRGPSGYIGTNRSCAQESVRSLVDDFNAGWPSRVEPAPARRPARAA
jgi:ferredoxin--NADP+ reductase